MSAGLRRIEHREDVLPIRGSFAISRGSRTESRVVVVEIHDGEHVGRGECTPYPRYDESVESVREQVEQAVTDIAAGIDRISLLQAMPAGAARNAVDCALWDLEAKRAGRRAWDLVGLPAPDRLVTAFTLSLDTPARMGEAAAAACSRPLLKLKLAGDGDLERVAAVRQSAPRSSLIVDANEGWTPDQVEPMSRELATLGVAMIEQPLPADGDEMLAHVPRPVPVCADESAHDRDTLGDLVGRYDFVNIKLDKTGGLTEALLLADAAEEAGFGLMVGCMLASSLSMAPAMLVASRARFVDLDGPLLLAEDRVPGIRYEGSRMGLPPPALWG